MSTATVLAKSAGTFLESLPPKHLAPLWTEMAKMVPPRPNPSATTAVWKYKEVRPLLMEAGEVVDAEEAERRVLMLVNPAMGNAINLSIILLTGLHYFRRTAYDRYHLWWASIDPPKRDSPCTPAYCLCPAFYHRRRKWFHGRGRPENDNGTRRCHSNTVMALARSRERRTEPSDLAGWARPPAFQVYSCEFCGAVQGEALPEQVGNPGHT
jgi:hypothetical protein